MKLEHSLGLSVILFIIGILIVIAGATNTPMIALGMLFIALAIISILIPVNFPEKRAVRTRAVKGRRKRKRRRRR